MLNTTDPNNYRYDSKHLEIHVLGGMKTTKLETLRITLSIQKLESHQIIRHGIDLYNDNQVEKFTRMVAERLELGTTIVRRTVGFQFLYAQCDAQGLQFGGLHPAEDMDLQVF